MDVDDLKRRVLQQLLVHPQLAGEFSGAGNEEHAGGDEPVAPVVPPAGQDHHRRVLEIVKMSEDGLGHTPARRFHELVARDAAYGDGLVVHPAHLFGRHQSFHGSPRSRDPAPPFGRSTTTATACSWVWERLKRAS